jgi:hypothetical protein
MEEPEYDSDLDVDGRTILKQIFKKECLSAEWIKLAQKTAHWWNY